MVTPRAAPAAAPQLPHSAGHRWLGLAQPCSTVVAGPEALWPLHRHAACIPVRSSSALPPRVMQRCTACSRANNELSAKQPVVHLDIWFRFWLQRSCCNHPTFYLIWAARQPAAPLAFLVVCVGERFAWPFGPVIDVPCLCRLLRPGGGSAGAATAALVSNVSPADGS